MKPQKYWRPSKLERDLYKKIKTQADALPDGWFDIKIESQEDHVEGFSIRVARIPFERWLRNSISHRWDEWPNICPLGLKGYQTDDTYHSDWWVSAILPIEYAYGERSASYNDYLDHDDPEYVPPPKNKDELLKKCKMVIEYTWYMKFKYDRERVRNSSFLVSTDKKVDGGVYHVKSVDDIEGFVKEAMRWKKAFNSRDTIAVVPNCSVEYDLVIRHAGAIITSIGSAAAHLVKVAREDNIPVILCPDAFNEYFHGEHVVIEKKSIIGKR